MLSLKVFVVKIFKFLVLQFKFAEVLLFFGSPKLPVKVPFIPSKFCLFRIIFNIPAVPSASYLADGEVTTSTFSIDSAGKDLSPWGPDMPTKPEGLPFINILTLIH